MIFSKKSLALIALLMLLCGCSGIDHFDLVVIDVTSADCTCVLEQVLTETLDKLDTPSPDQHSLNGHTLRVVQVNDRRGGTVYEASLPLIDNYMTLNPKKRVAAQIAYMQEDIPRMIAAACTPPPDSMVYTFLYGPLFENLGDLERSDADVKSATFYSDALQNGKVRFYSVLTRQFPVLLMTHKDSIIRDIHMHYGPAPDLRGIRIKLRHAPKLKDQDLHHYARKLMDLILTQQGADFIIERMIECDFVAPTQEPKTAPLPEPKLHAPPITDRTITI